MNVNFLPLAPGHLVVVDHYEGLRNYAVVTVCRDAEHAATEIALSVREIEIVEGLDPISFDIDWDCTGLVSVESFIS